MKRFYSLICCMAVSACMAWGQGWPADYTGVMLQGFYWDSYNETSWTALTNKADVLSKYFSMIWVPQSGNCGTAGSPGTSMGYNPKYYFDQNSTFGTETELRQMISTYKAKGTGIIADVVINHRANVSDWFDFPEETYNGVTYKMVSTDIVSDDDDGATKKEADSRTPVVSLSANADEGEGWSGMRDLDHKSSNVQAVCKAYTSYLKKDLGYAGFRYDMVKGFDGSHIADYNINAFNGEQIYSVGEYWDSNAKIQSWINNTKVNDTPQSAAFDFQFRYLVRDAINNSNWATLLGTGCLIANSTYRQYAVTFVENHDMEYRSASEQQDPIRNDTLAANAWLIANPGTPCVFYKHYDAYKTEIKQMIAARKLVGISNTSTYTNFTSTASYAAREVKGTNGSLLVVVGNGAGSYATPTGYKELFAGYHYRYFVTNSTDVSAWTELCASIEDDNDDTEADDVWTVPSCCVRTTDEMCAFFEAPSSWSETIYVWAWSNSSNFTGGTWPGVACTKVGTNSSGLSVWKWTYDGALTTQPTGVIFSNNSSPQTSDMTFTNGGYYTYSGGLVGTVPVTSTAVNNVTQDDEATQTNGARYNLAGQRVSSSYRGITIVNGKKYAK